MLKKLSKATILLLVLVVFLFLSLSWAQKVVKVKKSDLGSGEQGWLGVYLQEFTSELKESLDMDEAAEGVLISGVVEGSPAEEGGLENGDVIISFNDKRVLSVDNLTRLVRKASPGTEVELKIVRDGEKKIMTVTLGKSSSSNLYDLSTEGLKLDKKKAFPFKMSIFSGLRLGISIQDLTDQLGGYFGVKDGEGVLITEVEKESPAEQVGLKAGDVIIEADNRKVKDSDDIREIVSDKEKGDRVDLEILRDKKLKDFSITVSEDKEEWSFGIPEIEKLKRIEIYPEKLNPPEAPVIKGYSRDEKEFERELKELRKELQELKDDLEELREDMKR